jgi:hypothetical protein
LNFDFGDGADEGVVGTIGGSLVSDALEGPTDFGGLTPDFLRLLQVTFLFGPPDFSFPRICYLEASSKAEVVVSIDLPFFLFKCESGAIYS